MEVRDMARLYEIKGELEHLLARAIDLDTGEVVDEKALELFELTEGALEAKVVAQSVAIQELWAEATKVRVAAGALGARATALDARAEALRAEVAACCAPGSKFGDERVRVSVREGALRADVFDEALVPEQYVRTTTTVRRDAVRADLANGIEIPGAQLTRGANIVIIK